MLSTFFDAVFSFNMFILVLAQKEEAARETHL